jgi:glycosyltransferase involved in cell wall biosynthesis
MSGSSGDTLTMSSSSSGQEEGESKNARLAKPKSFFMVGILIIFFFCAMRQNWENVLSFTQGGGQATKMHHDSSIDAGISSETPVEVEVVQEQGRDWCGEWTARGNLGNTAYNARETTALSSNITSCPPDSTTTDVAVGSDYLPDRKVLHCHPPLEAHNRSRAILALDLQRLPRRQPEYSIVSPSHSSASVLQLTAPKLCRHTVGRWEIVFVLDSSYDESLQVLKNILLSSDCQQNPGLVRARILVQQTAIFETSSDNLGFTLLDIDPPSHFYVEIQSDMILEKKAWNRDLSRPLFAYNDIYSVSGRCGHSQGGGRYFIGRCQGNVGQLSLELEEDTRNSVIVTATNNRGPIIYRSEALRELGFFDERNFVLGSDDHDMNRRAVFRGWYAAYKYTHFYAPLNLSPGRNKSLVAAIPAEAKAKEREYLNFRQRKLPNRSCDGPPGFSPHNPRQATRMPLDPVPVDADPNEPLPALPPLFVSNNTRAGR